MPSPLPLVVITSLIAACASDAWPRPATMTQEQFKKEFNEWRTDRRDRLVQPGSGPVIWVGLWELKDGDYRVGSDSSLPIVLPKSQSTAIAGVFHRAGNDVTFEPSRDSRVQRVDSLTLVPVQGTLTLASDRTREATVLATGSLRLRVHGEPGTDRLWLRVWDEKHPAITTFQLPQSYPLDTTWRVAARLDRFDSTRAFEVPDIADGTQVFRSPGTLTFQVDGKEQHLVAFADTNSTSLFIMLWDSTAQTATYQAGRYLRANLPDSTGWTVLDFNRTYNPPCVFTPHSTCAFPPRENRLPLAITAGEKRAK